MTRENFLFVSFLSDRRVGNPDTLPRVCAETKPGSSDKRVIKKAR
jgi:hypothetical protein